MGYLTQYSQAGAAATATAEGLLPMAIDKAIQTLQVCEYSQKPPAVSLLEVESQWQWQQATVDATKSARLRHVCTSTHSAS